MVDEDDTNVFVKYLPPTFGDKELNDMFAVFGSIVSCRVMVDTIALTSLGYGFVRFATRGEAESAIQGLNQKQIGDKTLLCRFAKASSSKRRIEEVSAPSNSNLYVQQLPAACDDDQLRTLFDPYGVIQECKVMVDKNTGVSKQIGFVRYSSEAEASAAVAAMNNANVSGSILLVRFAETEEQKQLRKKKQRQVQYAPPSIPGSYYDYHPLNYAYPPQHPSYPSYDANSVHVSSYMSSIPSLPSQNPAVASQLAPMQSQFSATPQAQLPATQAPLPAVAPQPQSTSMQPQLSASMQLMQPPLPGMQQLPTMQSQHPAMQPSIPMTSYPPQPQQIGPQLVQPVNLPVSNGSDQSGGNLFVFHLPADIDDNALFQLFCEYGEITSLKVMFDKQTSRSKGFGFVNFKDLDSAVRAIHGLHGRSIGSKRLKVEFKRTHGITSQQPQIPQY